MRNTRIEQPPEAYWYDGLTSTHWRVLRRGLPGWIFVGFEALALVVVLAPMLTREQALSSVTPVALAL